MNWQAPVAVSRPSSTLQLPGAGRRGMRLPAELALARLGPGKCAGAGLGRGAKALRSEMESTRHSVTELLATHGRESSAVNTSLLTQLVKVAVQCAHYFQYDRFSNEFMRGSLVHDGATEGIRLATLLEFPRMRVLCEGDINMLRAACTLLEHVRVDDTCVWFE